MEKRIWIPALVLLLLVVGYFIGPRPNEPVYDFTLPSYTADLSLLEKMIQESESSLPLREDNEARIIWCDSVPRVTPISIVYLHGFAGSYRDGYPMNVNVAKALGANIYLSRWAGHGMKPQQALENFTPEAAWRSAREALAIGNKIGDKVVLLSTSTGGTLSLFLAAHFPNKVHGMVNIGPNIEDDQFGSFLLDSPWGYELAHLVSLGEHRKIQHESDLAYQYWDSIYPAEALINLELLVHSMMTDSTFAQVKCPVLTMYYHKNFLKEDEHVEVSVYDRVYEKFSTPDSLLKLKPLDRPNTHFVGSDIKSEDYKTAQKIAVEFIESTIVN
ncbi:MAG TPA: alpha/beta fold hydrolase [Cryomorphaceae bacterium]|nr:alpha/beta fold hydrolase [Cryomorphaceae bacterium]HKL39239.1 alpha/beta fold hydrolase [Cryomorphaceae bacterium]